MTYFQENPFYTYQAIVDRPPLVWPNGKKLAVFVGLNVEHYAFGKRSVGVLDAVASRDPDPINFGWRDYGVRVGIWRIAELLERLSLTPSVLLSADVCEAYPKIIEEGRRAGWCWVAHGKNNSMFAGQEPPRLDEAEERTYLADVFATIERSTDVRTARLARAPWPQPDLRHRSAADGTWRALRARLGQRRSALSYARRARWPLVRAVFIRAQ